MNKKNSLAIILAITLTVLLIISGCAQDSDDDKGSDSTATELEGTWNKACSYNSTALMDILESFVFSGESYHMYNYFYDTTNDSCGGTLNLVQDGIMTFSIGNALDPTTDLKEIDITLTDLTYTPKSNAGITLANTDCSGDVVFTAMDETKSVKGFACDHLSTVPLNTTLYSVYRLNTSVTPNVLQFGDVKTSIAERPTTIAVSADSHIKQ
ncbi:hypothetical protein KKA14_12905 [bacterium]|nr:hypothetical protein [bacterium]